ncbi:MAG: hypothetical protein KDC42_04240 [Ignavibacteriae bacterium]|nr:hypothetical protein [Ignavibacteriota bacterium]
MKIFTALVFVLVLTASTVYSQDDNDVKVSGYAFGDYFYKVDGDSSGSGTQYSNLKKDYQGFDFRRIYVTLKKNISKDFSANVTLEGNSGTTIGGKYGLYFKVIQLSWKNLIPMGQINLGLISPNTYDLEQDIWSYRSIEKTVGDFRNFGNSSDVGVSVQGDFDKKGMFSYFAMFGGGTGQKPIFTKNKKVYGQLTSRPAKGFVIAAYGDYESNGEGQNGSTIKGTAGYNSPQFNIGAVVYQLTKSFSSGPDMKPFAFSVFAWAPLATSKNLTVNAFARFDMYDPDTESSNTGFKQNFITGGLDFMPVKNVHFMPNIWVNSYTDKSSSNIDRPTDVVARLTFYYKYE